MIAVKLSVFLTLSIYSDINILTNHYSQIEFDSPQELLQKKGGAFKGMVDGSGDKKALYTMAEKKVVT